MSAGPRMVFDELRAVSGHSLLPDRKDVDVYQLTLNDESLLALRQLLAHWRASGQPTGTPGIRSLVDLVERSPFPDKAAKAQYARFLLRTMAQQHGMLPLCPQCAAVLDGHACRRCAVAWLADAWLVIPVGATLEDVLALLAPYELVAP